MLRQFIIGLMKALLDVAIALSLLVVASAIAVTFNSRNIPGWLVIGEIVAGAFALVALFGLLSLLIEINENLIRLRETSSVRRADV